jgi:hypothetical protein
MAEIKLKTLHQWRYDNHSNTVTHAGSLILKQGEPFFISQYFDGSTTKDVLLLGDGSSTVSSLLVSNKFFVRGIGAGYTLPSASDYTKGGIKIANGYGLQASSTGEA